MNKRIVYNAIDQVINSFPFNNYLTRDYRTSEHQLILSVLKFVNSENRPKLLDIGSGPMNKTAPFSILGFECYAVDDLSDPWHFKANNREKIADFAHKMGIQFLQQDMRTPLPFSEKYFDVVLLSGVIEHLHESPREIINSAFSLLKDKRIIVIEMPNAVNLRKRISVLFGRTNYCPVQGFFHSKDLWRGHVREYTLSETEYILKECGGTIILSKTFHNHVNLKIRSKVLKMVYYIITSLVKDLKDGILVIAKKPVGWRKKEYSREKEYQSLQGTLPDGLV